MAGIIQFQKYFIKIFDAVSERFPKWHNVKISLNKLSCLINSRWDFCSRLLMGIDIEPFIEHLINSSFSLTSIRSILFNFADLGIYLPENSEIWTFEVKFASF